MAFNPKAQFDIIRTNQAIKDFHDFAEDYETRPPYQRKVVWDKKKQQALMDSLFRRYYIPSIVLREVNLDDTQSKWEVVDGQQRINTVQAFFSDKLALPATLSDLSGALENSVYSTLPTEIRKYVSKHLKFDVDIIKQIGEPTNNKHLEIATDIFWRLQQGDSLNKMETAHARLSSPVRNFIVKYADDYDFDYKQYAAIDPNPHKHMFFRETYTRTNSRMQHLTLLGRFLLLERALGPTRIGDNAIAELIDETKLEDGIGNLSYEGDKAAAATLETLSRLREVYEDDPKLDRDWVGVLIFKDAYFIVSFYLLLRHLLKHYVYTEEVRLCFREFSYEFFHRTKYLSTRDDSAREFVENNQQDATRIAVRDRIIRLEFFKFARLKSQIIIAEKDKKRAFNEDQRIEIYLRDNGLCQECLNTLPENEARVPWSQFEADHILPWIKGGETEVWNGQVLCRMHNQKKGASYDQ
ncbi:MAG: DUF262 domain-containing protein [Chloroflexi bacterium]|nr:DUF262 domain-containing protein [Chloroflexota bacterium]